MKTVKGTKDILPDQIGLWQYCEDIFRSVSGKFGYSEIRTPIFEYTKVFSRAIGNETDIVNKEMYTFEDRGGESITLRPEMTASVIRSVIQNSLHNKSSNLRLWYFGPFFRYERPQKGRMRQFHQFGAECILSPYPESDVENITLAVSVIKELGIKDFTLFLNSLGNKASRDLYREKLVKYLNSKKDQLSEESQRRLETNPLRVLDSKSPMDIAVNKDAPTILNYLDEESTEHFDAVKLQLDKLGIKYEIDPKLVRGLDYYSHTVFEFQSNVLGAQSSFGGGGRYNDMFQEFGEKPHPAVGFAMGVERIILILENQIKAEELSLSTDVYIISTSNSFVHYVNEIAGILRSKGLNVTNDLLRRSMKAQFREANKLNSRYCVIIGDDEFSKKSVQIKNMSNSEQIEVSKDTLENHEF